ncbi:MAG: cardiolipin synthase ClsB [Spongiibacteraceae bacterium]
MKDRWHPGNRVELLQDGDEFFPRVFAALRAARSEVFLETFILSDDKVGRELRSELIAAATRGVRVFVTVDGFGSPGLEGEFIDGLTAAGVHFHIFNPGLTLFGVRTNLFRRLHRKIIVIDGQLAFVGGINFIADQLEDFGPLAKRDYAVEIEGPVVADIHAFAEHAIRKPHRSLHNTGQREYHDTSTTTSRGSAKALFVTRDNRRARTHIERHYHLAIRQAQHELIIANAYFFPGYRLLWRLRQAARRGVRVSLILQGRPDIGLIKWASSQLYDYLLSSGVQIYEYCERPLHGKVAIADGEWSTVGSSNLDPLSLSLNLEANVVLLDREFNRTLRARLKDLMESQCQPVVAENISHNQWWRGAVSAVVFHFIRQFPHWANWLPRHTVALKKMGSAEEMPHAGNAEVSPPTASNAEASPMGSAEASPVGNAEVSPVRN